MDHGNKSQVKNTEVSKLKKFGTHCYTAPTKFIVPNGWTIEASCTTSCVQEDSVVKGCTKVVINVGSTNMKVGRGVVISFGYADMKMELGVVWIKGFVSFATR